MDQNRVYKHARDLLKMIEDIPLTHFTLGEMLFLQRYCLREARDRPNIVASFSEEELSELMAIAGRASARSAKHSGKKLS